MAANAASLHSALASLFSSDPEAQHRANAWVNAFAATHAAWEAGLTLLDAPDVPEAARFFAANMLLGKARGDFHRLPPDQRTLLVQAVRCTGQSRGEGVGGGGGGGGQG